MIRDFLFCAVFFATFLSSSKICADFHAGADCESRAKSGQSSLEDSLHIDRRTNYFTPNPLFYPPTHTMNPQTALQNDAFLHKSLYENHLRNINSLRLDP